MTTPTSSPIAVVGLAALFPGSVDKDGFWRDIVSGKDLITDVPASHWLIEDYYDADPKARDKTYARRGAFLPEIDFDAIAWGVPPSIVPGTDTTQLLALIVAQRVLEDALGTRYKDAPRDRVSVILGVTSAQELLGSMVSRLQRPVWVKALREIGLPESTVEKACDQIASQYVEWQESTFPGVLGNVVAGRIANRLDLGGTNCVSDAACASSFSALAMAVAELRLGESDLVITGGADTMNDIFMYVCFSKTPALSPTGDCRPFSDAADGTMLGEGIGMVALKRLADAERDGDKIYAIIAGVGASSDGRSKSVYAPVAAGQAKALRRAYAQAGYGPETVGLVEAHGTGTRAGDAAEVEALRTVFGESGRTDHGWCALGSVKSQIGHTKAASGAAGLFKAVMALHHRVLPPTIKVDRPDPKLALEASPFHLGTTARPWVKTAHPRRASVSSFGFGGSNFHVTLQEYEGPAARPGRVRPAGGEVVLFSAQTPAAVAAQCRALVGDAGRAGMLAYLARSTQLAFDPAHAVRLSIYAESESELAQKLAQAAALVDRGESFTVPGGIELAVGAADGALAFLFPGQGSQYLGMGADVTMALPAAQRAWDRAAAVALGASDGRLDEIVFPRSAFDEETRRAQEARLTATEWAQPALAATSLALLEVLGTLGVTPAAVGGHSFGEFTALCAAGAMTPEALLRAARRRGELMAETAGTPGAMISVAASVDELTPILAQLDGEVVIANYNTPRQLVLSGPTDAVERVEKTLAAAQLSATRLEVATAFHSPVVAAACAPLRAFLGELELRAPTIEVFGNGTAAPYPVGPDAIRDQLAAHLAQPVRFVEQIEAMYARGIRTFVEVGPGRVLSNLVGHILKKRPHRAIALDRKGRPGLASLHQALGSLSVAGVALRYDALWSDFLTAEDPRAEAAPKMALKLNGANHGKLYPPPGGHAALPRPNPEIAPSAPSTTALAAPAPGVDPSVQLAWITAFQEAQRQTAEAHAAYQRTTAEVHATFLRSADASLAGFAARVGAAPPVVASPTVLAPPRPVVAPVASMAPAPTRMVPPPTSRPVVARPTVAAPAPIAPAGMSLEALSALMITIVAEKTGYPAEVLGLDSDLEADLGVDSIKRVEILSATMERAPGLPKLNAAKMATLRTLRQIVGHLREQLGTAAPVAPASSPTVPVAAAFDVASLSSLMLAVVAEKTGYPAEVLGLDSDLEADLGVDSIKRVEILSATMERAPGLPKLNAAKMATLRTLRQIIGYLETAASPTPSPSPSPTPSPSPSASPTPSPSPSPMLSPLLREVFRAIPTPALGLATPGLLGAQNLIVTDEGTGIAAALVDKLAARGVHATVRDAVPADADAVIFLGGMQRAHDPAQALAMSRSAFHAARAVARRFTDEGGTFISVQDTGGDLGLSGSPRAWMSSPTALVRTAALEWPKATVRALDVERGARNAAELAGVILDELLGGGVEQVVGLKGDGTRASLRTFPVAASAIAEAKLDARSVVVVSGGARGVTAACVVALAQATRCRIALLGRSVLEAEPAASRGVAEGALMAVLLEAAKQAGESLSPLELGRRVEAVRATREIERTLADLRAAGAEARYLTVDVTREAELAPALAQVRAAWGPITGVIHGAGVLADKLIVDKRDEQWTRVFGTKVAGLAALLEATSEDPLRVLLLFSSVASVSGNPGQADYAMANEVLNKVSALEQRRRGPACLVRAIAWGPWDGGMVDEALRARFASLGVPLIPVAEGARRFVEELTCAEADAEVVIGGGTHGLGAHVTRDLEAALLVDRTGYPYLDGHRVSGTVVVPVALVIEWFARAARALRPELHLAGFRELKVLRGIRLVGYDGLGDRLSLRARQLSNGRDATLAIELVGVDGHRHYTATCELKAERPLSAGPLVEPSGLAPHDPAVYDGVILFHGPEFQAIERVLGVSEAAVDATILGLPSRGWSGAFELDPLLLDAGLQLALLWTAHRLGGAGLPTAIGRVAIHAHGPVAGRVRAVLTGGGCTAERSVCDIAFQSEAGVTVAELIGVEVHLLPRPPVLAGPILDAVRPDLR